MNTNTCQFIIKCLDDTPLENLKPNSRKKIIFTCQNCGKESIRYYHLYIKNEVNWCRSCHAKRINADPEIKIKYIECSTLRWKDPEYKKNTGNAISISQKKKWDEGNRTGKKKSRSFEEVKKSFDKENYQLLTTEEEWKTNGDELKYICPKGHYGKTDQNHWFERKQRCGICSPTAKLSYNFVYEELLKEGCILTTPEKEWKNARTKFHFICSKGHNSTIIWGNWKKGHRCSSCSNNSTSKPEKDILEYVRLNYSGVIIPNDRKTILNPYTNHYLELDIWLPILKKAIEFNGMYWHYKSKAIIKDKIKVNKCKELGIDLLIINEQNWVNDKQYCLDTLKRFIHTK